MAAWSLPSNYQNMSAAELQRVMRNAPSWAMTVHGKPTMAATTLKNALNSARARESGGGSAPAAMSTSGTPSDVSGAFQSALDALSGAGSDVEKMYQQGKRRAMSDYAINAINAGMGNTLNLGAAGLAYDEQNRAATNLGVAQAKAGIYQNLGQTAASIYGTNVGAQTSRYATDVGAQTSLATAGMSAGMANQANQLEFQTMNANQALQKYIADLNSFTTLQINNAVPSGTSTPSFSL